MTKEGVLASTDRLVHGLVVAVVVNVNEDGIVAGASWFMSDVSVMLIWYKTKVFTNVSLKQFDHQSINLSFQNQILIVVTAAF